MTPTSLNGFLTPKKILSTLQVLPQHIFKSRDPIVMGVMVENGIVKVGTPICVPSKSVSTHLLQILECVLPRDTVSRTGWHHTLFVYLLLCNRVTVGGGPTQLLLLLWFCCESIGLLITANWRINWSSFTENGVNAKECPGISSSPHIMRCQTDESGRQRWV